MHTHTYTHIEYADATRAHAHAGVYYKSITFISQTCTVTVVLKE